MNKSIILLVEDDELDIISFQRSLRKLNYQYELHTAYNGIEALNMLRDVTSPLIPDVIILDLNMPIMNGIEFLKVLRNDPQLMHLKVFIMTTSGDSKDRSATDKLGVAGYIMKPLNFTDNSKRTDNMDAFVEFHLRKILAGNNAE